MDPSIRFLPSQRQISVAPGTRLLDAARRAGMTVASACGAEGACARCGVRILAGSAPAESERESERKRANRIDPALRLACRIPVHGDLVVTAPYW